MITFTKFGEYGRLGNQLYQYAALKGLAKSLDTEMKLPNFKNKHWHGQDCLLDNFNISCGFLEGNETLDMTITEPCVTGFYTESIQTSLENISGNTDIIGFFQNTQYFSNVEDEIKEELSPKKSLLDDAKKYIDSIRKPNEKIVSVHLRRGDNTDGTNPEINMFSENDIFDEDTIFGAYLTKAMQHFTEKEHKFLVFTGGSRTGNDEEDIAWVKRVFGYDNKFVVSDSNNPVVDFSRIMSCDHNIIGHATSFGWWAAYLNKNEDKKVIAPVDYHLDGKTHLREGFYPKEWILE